MDETNFLIDLEHINVAGHHKVCDSLIVNIAPLISGRFQRRRSILPRLFADEETGNDSVDGDRSMDGSVSCKSRPSSFFFFYRLTLYLTAITMDDDLTPLERARRRKNKLAGA